MRILSTALIILCSLCSVTAQTPEQLKSYLPKVKGWKVSKKIEVFDPENLFDRINGSAPLFIENNFREMTSMKYTKGDEYITIQAYRHASPEDAFGMYASERSSGLKFLPIGGEAQADDKNIYFFSGNVYVKMWGHSADIANVLQTIAEGLAKKIDPNASYPPVLNAFPKEGKVPYSESYITSNYIGHTFLNRVYSAKYERNNKSYQVFVIDGKTKEGAKEVLDKYFTFTKQTLDYSEGKLMINDRYNGDISVLWNGQYIIGIFSADRVEVEGAAAILEETLKNLSAI